MSASSALPHVVENMSLYFDMLEQAADGVVIIDSSNRIVFFNTAAERLWGYPAAQVMGQNVNCLVPIEHKATHDGYIAQNRDTGHNRIVGKSREITFIRSNGDYVAAEMSISSALLGPQRERYYMAFIKGVTEESHRRKILDLQNHVFTQLAGEMTEKDIAGLLCAEAERMVPNSVAVLLQVTPNRELEILSGEGLPWRRIAALTNVILTEDDVAALHANPEDARAIVWHTRTTDGQEIELRDCWASAVFSNTGELIGIFALYSRNRDKITDWPQKIVAGCVPSCAAIIKQGRTRQHLTRLNHYDALTGLLNRASITAILKEMTTQASPSPFALLVLDLDLFQDINNVMGYDQGDALLQIVARRLALQCRGNFVLGRLGGDDFVVIIPGGNAETTRTFAENFTTAMSEPIEINGQELIISFSIGISLYPHDGIEIEQILNHADVAMREAKKTARGSFRLLSGVANDEIKSRLIIGSALRKAIRHSGLQLFYQPQICTMTGRLYGVEALARWFHPTLGAVPPSRFIPIAEETGQIIAIGRWSLEEACRQIVKWDKAGINVPVVSVNISAAHFYGTDLAGHIKSLLHRYELDATRLTIEITESVMMQNHTDAMTAIREIGVGLSLDDFGTGFSSLSRLAHMPLTEIKIDRSFVMNFERDVSALIVTEAAINIGKRLGVKVVTEGVEEICQETRLRAMGCDVMQGYLFSKPMPPADLPKWIADFSAPANRTE
ncbi:EAL domain-containing protein [Acetobacter sp. TBRC 12305]|uniref:EAL domain-containing protein n=1 Tax=Acetobacter garciniae TaxID=2817435 RepID=A0A939HPA4_9PROT|nr:EAL domain-containing protein [Acetobacter garciniae]MBO1325222.1 EAL domain-containing protein [Acetobacter garciniae]MBX0344807.1 EAL domain-containing protein [Acetobacter garciniae]